MALATSAFRLNLTRPVFKHASCTFASSASWMALSASSSDSGWNRGVSFGGMVVVKKRKDIPFSSHGLPFIPRRLLLPLLKTPPKFPTASHWLLVFVLHVSPLIVFTVAFHLGSQGEILEGGILLCSITPLS